MENIFPCIDSGTGEMGYGGNLENRNWQNCAELTCSCPRDLRLSASWGTQFRALLKPPGLSHHCRIEGFKGHLQWVPHYAEDDVNSSSLAGEQRGKSRAIYGQDLGAQFCHWINSMDLETIKYFHFILWVLRIAVC